jgi:DNA-binding transcriptional LysR family regulator
MQAAFESQGVALSIVSYIQPEIDSGRLIRLTDIYLEPERVYYLLTRVSPTRSREMDIVCNWLRLEVYNSTSKHAKPH